MPEIAKFVRYSARGITPALAAKVLKDLPTWKIEFTQLNDSGFPHYYEQLCLLENLVEDCLEGACPHIPYATLAESLFALLYCHRKLQLAQTREEEPEHADDALIVRAVFNLNHKELTQYIKDCNKAASKLPLEL